MPVAKFREVVTRICREVATIWLTAAANTQNQNAPPGEGMAPRPTATSAERYTAAKGRPKRKRVNAAPLTESCPLSCRWSALRAACDAAAPTVMGTHATLMMAECGRQRSVTSSESFCGNRLARLMIDPSLFPALLSLSTVARSGSVGAAARQQHRTPSAISQQIRKVEGALGVKLLERAGRGVRLTAAGEAMLPALGRLWSEAEALFGELALFSGRPVTTVRVAVSDYLGDALLVPVLRAFADRQEPARFEIVTTHSRDALARVGRGEVEFGVVSAGTIPSGLDPRFLFNQTFVWVGPRLRRRARESLVERLAREPLLRLGAESQGRLLLDDFLERAGIRPRSTIDVTSVSLLLSYVSGGLGVGLAPAMAINDALRRHAVVESANVPPTPVQLVSRPASRRNPISGRFAEAVVAEGRALAARRAKA